MENAATRIRASCGHTAASGLAAACQRTTETLLRERKTITSACEQLTKLIAADQAQADAAAQRERETAAAHAAAGIAALNQDIDAGLIALRKQFEVRGVLLGNLAQTECISSMVIARMASRGPATSAVCYAGLGRWFDISGVPNTAARPLAEANTVLLSVGPDHAANVAKSATNVAPKVEAAQ